MKTVRILGVDFKIERKKLKKAHGQLEPHNHVIYIDSELEGDQLLTTLFHEMVHAALYVSGQGNTMSSQREEGIVLMMEHAFFELVKPQLAKGLKNVKGR